MFKRGCWKKVLRPDVKREVINYWKQQLGQSVRKGCQLIALNYSTYYYKKKAETEENQLLRKRMRELASERPRFGSPRLHEMLKREGWIVNHKRIERIYSEEDLTVRRKKKRKMVAAVRVGPEEATQMNEIWAMDFVSEKLWHKRSFRALTIVDVFTKECLSIKVDTSINGESVARELGRLIEYHGKPKVIRSDNGPEFISTAVDGWMYHEKIDHDRISPGKPIENCYIESFNGKFRDECLNQHYFSNLHEARETIEMWREDYNTVRPHQSLNNLTPQEFKEQLELKTHSIQLRHTPVVV